MATYTEIVDRIMTGEWQDATDAERDEAVHKVLQACSVAAGAVAFQPVPFLDTALIAPIQIAMVQAIGRIRGHKIDRKSIVEMLSTFGASIVAQNVILAAAKFVPFFGWIVGISMAYALTWAVGEVSDFYFQSGRGAKPEELRQMFRRVYREKRTEKEESAKQSSTLKDRLEQLREARRADLIDDDEFARKKEEILAAL